MTEYISIRGANVHNLKNINLDIPKNKLVVITGISGSGKSSLAFDTLYAEGQRRYIESLSAYARQFLGMMEKPNVEKIEGLSPAISIDQKSISRNPRSTVGTTTEIYDYLRLLYARVGEPRCPHCKKGVSRQTPTQITERIIAEKSGRKFAILAPQVKDKKGEHRGILDDIEKAGFIKIRLDGVIMRLEEAQGRDLDRYKKHNIEAVVDRVEIPDKKDVIMWRDTRNRIADSVETALKYGRGFLILTPIDEAGKEDVVMSENFACADCGIDMPEIEPRTFSFNSPYGACSSCTGLGRKLVVESGFVIPNAKLTIAEGAIRPWLVASHRLGRQGWYWRQLRRLAKREGFSLHRPVKDLPIRAVETLLYGNKYFEGVVSNLERRWRETDSDFTRAEIEKYMIEKVCEVCGGKRLRDEALSVYVKDKSIDRLVSMSVEDLKSFVEKLRFSERDKSVIAKPILKEVAERLKFLMNVGLEYLTLERSANTLSGGEAQRIRLATQIGSGLSGVLYILDEPSIGLHQRDQERLINTLRGLRDLGNTVVVVEHDEETIRSADWVIDIGPGAGYSGGEIIFEGTPKKLAGRGDILTGQYLKGKKKVKRNLNLVKNNKALVIKGAKHNNLQGIDVRIPLNGFVVVSGVSGSGKSTLVNDILSRALARSFHRAKATPGEHKKIEGLKNLNKVILVDQSPIGRTPRSNPATYTGAFEVIRELFAETREARLRGYRAGRFSFNVKGGRCENCQGDGLRRIEMHFLPDVYVECEECGGRRYNKEALSIIYNGKNIHEVLNMSVGEAYDFFENIPKLKIKLLTLKDVGLGYLKLGQPAPTLSGGEAQRIKLATELSRKATGSTLYILDEPTTGLHFDDTQKLLNVLHKLVEMKNSVLIIEHNLDIIKNADWIIDLGPEGGGKGGQVVAEGDPGSIRKAGKKSHTAKYL